MVATQRRLNSIRPYPGNPRHNDPAVDAVARSLTEFGFRQPIVIDGEDVIIVGHTRFKAALKLAMAEVPVHVAAGLTPAQTKAYRLADNRTAVIAAEVTGRRAALLELDSRYCDVIVERWEGFSGRVAERVPGAADVAVPA